MESKIKIYSKIPPRSDIKIEAFDPEKRYTKPHRHNKYMEIVFFSQGSGMHYLDETTFSIEPPIIFIINKDAVHHWEINTIPKGFVILIKQAFIEKTLDKHINLQLKKLELQKVIAPGNDTVIPRLLEIATTELRENPEKSDILIEGVLKALFSKFLSHTTDSETQTPSKLAERFSEQLELQLKNDVSHYAELLGTSSQNLNAICKKKFNKTASNVIAEQLIKETKRLLLYTNLSVSEIAFKFDFKDVSHFVKYFKRYQGKTPLQFKKTTLVP